MSGSRPSGDPAVTAVVVSYNHALYVAEALDSVAGQSSPPSRIIVVDDASVDDSARRMEQWIADHPGLHVRRIFHVRNTGLSRALNEALEMVDTPLYTVLAADDRMLPTRLEEQLTRWRCCPTYPCAVYSDAHRIDEHGRRLEPDYGVWHDWASVPSFEGSLHTNLLRHNWIPAASVLLSAGCVREVGGYNEEWFIEDHDLWLRLAATGREIVYVDKPLVEIRELPTSLGSTNFGSDRPRHVAARLGILLDQLGVSAEGDAYIRSVVPHLASRLWEMGERPDLVIRAWHVPGLDSARRWRLSAGLVRMGMTKDPRTLHPQRRVLSALRRPRT